METTISSPFYASSPSHEFSFTISLHPSNSPLPTTTSKSFTSNTSSAIDLSPADDIFLHGHLLPLLPPPPTTPSISQPLSIPPALTAPKEKTGHNATSKPVYSLFSIGWKKTGSCLSEDDDKKKKANFDLGRLLKKYAVALETFLFSGVTNRKKRDLLQRRPCSFSESTNWRGREELIERRRRWGQFSAPASMRTSPTDSSLIVAMDDNNVGVGSSEESTMEELQNAIQAAIAHCKSSINVVKKEM